MKRLHGLAVGFGVVAVPASVAAVILAESLPYRIGINDYTRYQWVGRVMAASAVLAILTLVVGLIPPRKWLPVTLSAVSLFSLLLVGGAHSGPNPQAWCYGNLRYLDAAKDRLASEQNLKSGTVVTMTDLSPLLPKEFQAPRCANRGHYIIGPIGGDPRCAVHGTISEMEAGWQKQRSDPAAKTVP